MHKIKADKAENGSAGKKAARVLAGAVVMPPGLKESVFVPNAAMSRHINGVFPALK